MRTVGYRLSNSGELVSSLADNYVAEKKERHTGGQSAAIFRNLCKYLGQKRDKHEQQSTPYIH